MTLRLASVILDFLKFQNDTIYNKKRADREKQCKKKTS